MTIRRLMILVAIVSGLIRMTIVAIHVGSAPESRWIYNGWERIDGPDVGPRPTTTTLCAAPFWPRYWRRLLGRPWPGSFRCECSEIVPMMIGTGRGKECAPYRYIGSRAVSRDEAEWIPLTLHSLKVLGSSLKPPAVHVEGGEKVTGEAAELSPDE